MKNKRIRTPPKAILADDLFKILITLKNRKIKSKNAEFIIKRNWFLVLFHLVLGLRTKEVINSKLENLDFKKMALFIPKEDNKQRVCGFMPLPKFIKKELLNYLEIRKMYYPNSIYLFPSSENRRLDRSAYDKMFRAVTKEAGVYHLNKIDGNGYKRGLYTPYNLRHTFLTSVYNQTLDIKSVSIMGRHTDKQMRTASLYVHCNEDLKRFDIMDRLFNDDYKTGSDKNPV